MKHAARYVEGTNVALLDPNVAAVFPNLVTVYEVLRDLAPFVQPGRRSSARKRRGVWRAAKPVRRCVVTSVGCCEARAVRG